MISLITLATLIVPMQTSVTVLFRLPSCITEIQSTSSQSLVSNKLTVRIITVFVSCIIA